MLFINIDKVSGIITDVAAQFILPRYGRLTCDEVEVKADNSLVTKADRQAEKALRRLLKSLLPKAAVIGEEAFAKNSGILSCFSSHDAVWIIDPIDGTGNYATGSGAFGVIVALAYKGQTVAGWLHNPVTGNFVVTELGGGAYFQRQKLRMDIPGRFTDLRGSFGGLVFGKISALADRGASLGAPSIQPPARCACHEYARLALSGQTNDPWHFRGSSSRRTPWDDAAGVLCATEAGGCARHWDGRKVLPGNYGGGLLVAPDEESWRQLRAWAGQRLPQLGL